MKYLLDTNICIYLIKEKSEKLLKKLQTKDINDIGISSLTQAELEYGVFKSQRQSQNKLALLEFLAPITIIPFGEGEAERYGEIRASLEKSGKTIGNMDLLIGAHALSKNLTLVTNNEKEFNRIVGLVIENWIK